MPFRRGLLTAFLCVLAHAAGPAARGQIEPDKSRALLRQDPDTTVYYVEVQLDAAVPSLDPGVPPERRPAPLSDLNTFLRHKKTTVRRASDVMLCAPGPAAYKNYLALRGVPGRPVTAEEKRSICEGSEVMPWRYYFWLRERPLSQDGYAVSYDFTDASNVARGDSLTAQTDYVAQLADGRAGCVVDKKAPPPHFPEGPTVPVYIKRRDAPSGAPASDEEYLAKRLEMIYSQMRVSSTAKMRIEPREDNVAPEPVTARVTWLDYKTSKPEQRAMQGAILVCVEPEGTLPAGEFHVEVSFTDNPPVELSGPLAQTLKLFTPTAATALKANEVVEEKKLGMRSLTNKLDAAIAFTSAVKDEEKEVGGQKVKVRSRDNDWVLDAILVPKLKERRGEPVEDTWVRYVTPFFLDAKISTGKIDKDTLSVNRFIIGYEREYRHYRSTKVNERNIYRVFGRLLHTSDRDLKRPEVKAQVEFRPTFDFLNEPLEYEYFNSSIFPDRKEDRKRLKCGEKVGAEYVGRTWWGCHFGYLVQPFGGAEAGRTYREGRAPLAVEEASRNLRRLFFGMDISLFLTEKVTFTINDTFYVRGETPSDRGRNYFKSEANFFFNDSETTPAQSFFLSFERGDQPPFVSKSVNVFKGGYRIRSNLPGLLGP